MMMSGAFRRWLDSMREPVLVFCGIWLGYDWYRATVTPLTPCPGCLEPIYEGDTPCPHCRRDLVWEEEE